MSFIAVAGAPDLYRQAAKLEGMDLHSWIRIQLHARLREVWEEHGIKTPLPRVHIPRPPRLQPREEIDRDPALLANFKPRKDK